MATTLMQSYKRKRDNLLVYHSIPRISCCKDRLLRNGFPFQSRSEAKFCGRYSKLRFRMTLCGRSIDIIRSDFLPERECIEPLRYKIHYIPRSERSLLNYLVTWLWKRSLSYILMKQRFRRGCRKQNHGQIQKTKNLYYITSMTPRTKIWPFMEQLVLVWLSPYSNLAVQPIE